MTAAPGRAGEVSAAAKGLEGQGERTLSWQLLVAAALPSVVDETIEKPFTSLVGCK